MLGLFGPKSDEIELCRAALLYLDPLKESVSTESRVNNEVVLEGKFYEVRLLRGYAPCCGS
jgi:hypothetical protein